MRKTLFCLCFAALLSQTSWQPAMAQGDPVPGGGGVTPTKIEVIEAPNNNGLINALQNFQFQQNQQQSIFNSTAVKVNPAISPLDQRTGLIQNSTNVNIFGVNGLGISTSGNPQINNSHLLADGNNLADARSLANFLMSKPTPFVNVAKEIVPVLSHVPPTQLIAAIGMILGFTENQIQDLMLRAANGAFNNNQLIDLAINIKTQKISLSDAKLALAQIVAPPTKVASATTSTTKTITTNTTNVGSTPSITGDQINITLLNVATQMKNSENTSTQNDIKVTQDQKRDMLDQKLDKLNQATQKIENAIKTEKTNSQIAFGTKVVTTVISPITLPTTIGSLVTNTTNSKTPSSSTVGSVVNTVGSVVSTIGNTLGITSSSSAKGQSVAAVKPSMPDPTAIAQASVITILATGLKLPPILAQTVMVKAASGHFNNSPALTTLTSVLSNPKLSASDAQALVLGFLQASAKPGDIPAALIISATGNSSGTSSGSGPSVTKSLGSGIATQLGSAIGSINTSSASATTQQKAAETKQVEALIKQLNGFIDQGLSNLGEAGSKFDTQLNALINAVQQTSNTMNTIKTNKGI